MGANNFEYRPCQMPYRARCRQFGYNTPLSLLGDWANRRSHRTPERDCKCGFWAYWLPKYMPYQSFAVSGIIEGYGKTIIGPLGFRAQFCNLKGLLADPYYLKRSEMDALRRYGVPIYENMLDLLREQPLTEDYVKL